MATHANITKPTQAQGILFPFSIISSVKYRVRNDGISINIKVCAQDEPLTGFLQYKVLTFSTYSYPPSIHTKYSYIDRTDEQGKMLKKSSFSFRVPEKRSCLSTAPTHTYHFLLNDIRYHIQEGKCQSRKQHSRQPSVNIFL